ncbi:hypothetical protein HKD37_17G048683 [Glycine soja]
MMVLSGANYHFWKNKMKDLLFVKNMHLPYKDEAPFTEHLSEFQGCCDQLSATGINFDDDVLGLFLLITLTDSWETFQISIISVAPNGIVPLQMAKTSALNEKMRRKTQGISSQLEVLVTENRGEARRRDGSNGEIVVCSPEKKKRSLGIFNLKDWNLALLSRILWNFHCKKDSLWVRWVHHYYFRGSDVWNYNTSSSDSALIKKIIQIRDFIISKELSTKEAKKRIQSWSTNEQLLVGKVYEYIRGVKPTVSWCSVIWNPAIPPNISFILWLAKKNRLLTLDKAAFLNKDSLCPLYSNEVESNAHLFFSCRKSLHVWAHIRFGSFPQAFHFFAAHY